MAEYLADAEMIAFRQGQSQAQAMRRIQEQLQAREVKLQQIEQQQCLQQEQNERDYQGARRQLAYNARGNRNLFPLPSPRLLTAHS